MELLAGRELKRAIEKLPQMLTDIERDFEILAASINAMAPGAAKNRQQNKLEKLRMIVRGHEAATHEAKPRTTPDWTAMLTKAELMKSEARKWKRNGDLKRADQAWRQGEALSAKAAEARAAEENSN